MSRVDSEALVRFESLQPESASAEHRDHDYPARVAIAVRVRIDAQELRGTAGGLLVGRQRLDPRDPCAIAMAYSERRQCAPFTPAPERVRRAA